MLLARPHWIEPDSGLRAGVGLGQRKKPDPFDLHRRPYLGIRVEGPEAAFDHFLTQCPKWEKGSWDWWPRWELLELDCPAEAPRLLEAFAQRAADRVLDLFHQYAQLVEDSLAAAQTPGASKVG
ncbi:hypothetical protein [Streptacidiphilus carbonis]|uniref:hypothetical protein n=1 Tax=Streptacidiphilus carbonis TaxID=105422 RepID=UPI0005A5FF40|nr:hypothetical protein [Streptacidiphilus carbonis]